MLKFEKIEKNLLDIKSIADVEMKIPKSYQLTFHDNELSKESVAELKNLLISINLQLMMNLFILRLILMISKRNIK